MTRPMTAADYWEAARRVNEEAASVDSQIQRLMKRHRELISEGLTLEMRARNAPTPPGKETPDE